MKDGDCILFHISATVNCCLPLVDDCGDAGEQHNTLVYFLPFSFRSLRLCAVFMA